MSKKILFGLIIPAFLIAGTSTNNAAFAADAKLVAAAQKEGKLIVYHSINRKVLKKMAKAFGKKYGIKVSATRKSTGGVNKMVAAERLAGVLRCDVVSAGDPTLFRTWKKQGVLQPYVPTSTSAFYKGTADPEGFSSPARRTFASIGYSKKQVKDADAPKGWEDILDPKWKGKIGIIDPRTSGPGRYWLAGMVKRFGWGYIEKIAQQNPIMIKSSSSAKLNLISGEVALTIPGSEHSLTKAIKKGEPVGLVYPKEGSIVKTSRVGICSKAKNINAAKLWIEYETGKVGQALISKHGAYITVRPDVAVHHPRPKGALDPSSLIDVPEDYMRKNKKAQRKKFADIMSKAMLSN
ncbi:MAG: extracellular solute-binding protein [Rhodospirillales bacterium]|jgi:iron(III) transport system substrate-binding protein|nr:extracellular solute-binding protein [Rhodospirillales bacterium]